MDAKCFQSCQRSEQARALSPHPSFHSMNKINIYYARVFELMIELCEYETVDYLDMQTTCLVYFSQFGGRPVEVCSTCSLGCRRETNKNQWSTWFHSC